MKIYMNTFYVGEKLHIIVESVISIQRIKASREKS